VVLGGTDGTNLRAIKLDASGEAQVDVLTLPALAAGTNNIGDVDVLTLPNVTLAAGTNTNEVVGDAAHDAAAAGNPVLVGGFASAAAPTGVSADGDAVRAWYLRNGAQATVLTAAGALVGGDATNGIDVDVTRLPALAAGTNNIGDVDVLTLPALPAGTNNIGDVDVLTGALPTGASTLAEQQTQTTALQLLDDAVATTAAAIPTKGLAAAGTDGTNARILKTDAAGELQVDVLTLPALAAGANNIGDVDVLTINGVAPAFGSGLRGATVQRVTVATDDVVPVSDNGGSLTVDGTVTANLAAGTNNIGDVDVASIAAGDNNIGNVDIVTMPNVTLAASTNTIEVVGDVAHDAAAAGNPVLVGASHETAADSAPTNRLASVTDGDVTRLSAMDGALFVIPSAPQQWKARLTGAMTDTTVKAAPGAGLSLYIQTIVYSIGAATASSILLEESTTTPVFGPHYLEAINGRGMAVTFNPPIKVAANTLLSATSTGATTNTLDVYGFTAPG
jgi:hypothetical protein